MGSGSSRSGRALRRLRSPDSRPAGPGGAASEGGTRPLVSATAAAAAREEAREAEAAEGAADPDPDRDPGPADGGNETLRLLDQLLAESAAWGPGELVPRGPARPKPAAGAGSRVSSKQSADEHPESSRVSRNPGGSHGRPEKPSGILAISYDYSEEELMASIEQEYCR
ncbi:cystin-1 isoform X2 [Zalophus californianus]|uniref:Cystin-1 isoform X2 n=1 Tax=Zalophus californianus TaxID=9704 RepID=A0A6J2FF13_ZALCA|nr:cystin-1 isoform X2 [Zalophus californianus]